MSDGSGVLRIVLTAPPPPFVDTRLADALVFFIFNKRLTNNNAYA